MSDTPPANPAQSSVSPFYHSAVNSITRPNQTIFCSRYFVKRWMPLLGSVGTQIVLYLRSLGFYNRQTGERRDEVSVSLREIAQACGCSYQTVRRELAKNDTLKLFVQVRPQWEEDPRTGQPRQAENVYRIAMDDPLHESDWGKVEDYIAKETTLEKGKEATPLPKWRGGTNCDGGGNKLETPPSQFGRANEVDTYLQIRKETLNVEKAYKDKGNPSDNPQHSKRRNIHAEQIDKLIMEIVTELGDFHSGRRHRQLLEICDQHGLISLPQEALLATRKRMASEAKLGRLEKPGAYYQSILIKLLEDHQVFVPSATAEERAQVSQEIRQSLGLDGS